MAEAATALSARRSGQEVSVSGPRSQATDLLVWETGRGPCAPRRRPHGTRPARAARLGWQPRGRELGQKAGFSGLVKPVKDRNEGREGTGGEDGPYGETAGLRPRVLSLSLFLGFAYKGGLLQGSEDAAQDDFWKAALGRPLRPSNSTSQGPVTAAGTGSEAGPGRAAGRWAVGGGAASRVRYHRRKRSFLWAR